jgi:prepilin-type processing-associated H-X9-DG protein
MKYTLMQKPDPSRCFVFIDENPGTVVDAQFGIPPSALANEWWDMPSSRHSQGGNLSFADGHVEHWRWAVPKIYQGWIPQGVSPAEEPDYRRVRAAMVLDSN